MTKIDIVSGFLGAGKTTFIKRVLEIVKNEKTIFRRLRYRDKGDEFRLHLLFFGRRLYFQP